MIPVYTAQTQKDFLTKSEHLMNDLLIISDKLYLCGYKDKELLEEFNKTFKELFFESAKDNFCWLHCPSKVYINTYETRQKEFLKTNIESDAIAFTLKEKDFILALFAHDRFCFLYKVNESKNDQTFNSTKGFNIIKLDREFKEILKLAKQNKIKFLDDLLLELNPNTIDTSKINLHPRYFQSNGFPLFESLKERIVRKKYILADYSFIYRQMQRDSYIYPDITEKSFRDWLLRTFQIEITEPLKTLDNCSTELKIATYSSLVNSK